MDIKTTAISILIALVLIGVALVFFVYGNKDTKNTTTGNTPTSNVSISGGRQVVTINAKGGYYPKITSAKAGIPTVIKMDTQGTFDCSSALAIPSLGYRANLPPSGQTVIDVPPQQSGSKLQGLCSMGMYGFQINFN